MYSAGLIYKENKDRMKKYKNNTGNKNFKNK